MKRVLLGLFVMASISCGSMTREGTASSYLVVSALQAASGADPEEFGGVLESDVATVVDGNPTIYGDFAEVSLVLALKDPRARGVAVDAPTPNNAITVDRYRVRYIRSDGRNTQGVDVPYTFDGAFTATVFDRDAGALHARAARRPRLKRRSRGLANSLLVISTIAEITFYGHDQTGREVIATAAISVHFANFGDPK